jgi:hypothetical protein
MDKKINVNSSLPSLLLLYMELLIMPQLLEQTDFLEFHI